mmetsp:Transcript_7882/g.23164  ORF Transcript_7882/g.23164 Transcript_7882/m.23164 type:complete len:403 (+) Transcript_7882:839-2047(+)
MPELHKARLAVGRGEQHAVLGLVRLAESGLDFGRILEMDDGGALLDGRVLRVVEVGELPCAHDGALLRAGVRHHLEDEPALPPRLRLARLGALVQVARLELLGQGRHCLAGARRGNLRRDAVDVERGEEMAHLALPRRAHAEQRAVRRLDDDAPLVKVGALRARGRLHRSGLQRRGRLAERTLGGRLLLLLGVDLQRRRLEDKPVARPHLALGRVARQVAPALREHRVDGGLGARVAGRRNLERGGPLQHALLALGSEQPRLEGALDADRVHRRVARLLHAVLDRDEAERLAEHGALHVGEVHEDPVGKEHEPVVLELRAAAALRRLLLEQPAVRHVGDLLLQHDDLLQPQLPRLELEHRLALDLEVLVSRHDLEHLVTAALLDQFQRLRQPRVDLARVDGR